MKRLNIFFVGLIILLAGISCDTAKNPYHSPKSITKAFSESLYTGHFDEAKKYVTPESVPVINFFQHAFPPEKFEGCDHITLDEITVKQLTDSTALCKCIVHLCNGKTGNESTNVLKRDGKWYVSLRQAKEGERQLTIDN
jgi:hypothetical protein